MTTATAHKVDLPEQLEWLLSTLGRAERTELGVSLLEIVRHDVVELEAIQQVFSDWAATAAIRHHPEFGISVKEYHRLAESGELFADTDLTDQERAAIQRAILTVD